MTTMHNVETRYTEAAIEADDKVPAIHIWRDFDATPAQLFRAHTDPELFAQWSGIDGRDEFETSFHGCFHTVRGDRIVQTFTWDGMPDDVALETMTFEDLGDGRTRLHGFSLCDSFESRDGWLSSGMETGVHDGYAAIDRLLADGTL